MWLRKLRSVEIIETHLKRWVDLARRQFLSIETFYGRFLVTFPSLVLTMTAILIVGVCCGEANHKEGFVGQKFNSKSVPVVPNESIVTARVLGCCVISSSILDIKPDQNMYKLELLIHRSQDVKPRRNFTMDKVGKVLSVYSKEKLLPELFNKVINAHVTYRGDERGGRFWIWDIKVLKTELE